MAGRAPQRPGFVAALSIPDVADDATSRALGQVVTAVTRLQSAPGRAALIASLVIGTNRIPHGLGRAVVGYTLTPTVADATFAHCLNTANARPEREVWIDVIGCDQPSARVEVF